jgi:hypothetical protein
VTKAADEFWSAAAITTVCRLKKVFVAKDRCNQDLLLCVLRASKASTQRSRRISETSVFRLSSDPTGHLEQKSHGTPSGAETADKFQEVGWRRARLRARLVSNAALSPRPFEYLAGKACFEFVAPTDMGLRNDVTRSHRGRAEVARRRSKGPMAFVFLAMR